jgi:hypothetical protein
VSLKWKKEPGTPGIQAPISHGGSAHDYVISHRKDQHTVSHRPPGKHEHVGTFTTEREAKAAAEKHAKGSRAGALKKKSPAQLQREIDEVLASKSSHSTKSVTLDKDDARMYGRQAYRMEKTKEQALSGAREMGFAAHHLGAVEDGWDGERRDTVHGGFAGSSHATKRRAPRVKESQAMKDLREARERYLRALDYAKTPAQLESEIEQVVGKRIDRRKLGAMMGPWGGRLRVRRRHGGGRRGVELLLQWEAVPGSRARRPRARCDRGRHSASESRRAWLDEVRREGPPQDRGGSSVLRAARLRWEGRG